MHMLMNTQDDRCANFRSYQACKVQEIPGEGRLNYGNADFSLELPGRSASTGEVVAR
jgi:hypothetical protein